MEEDPFQQGFCPEYFDLVCICETLHIAKDVKKTLSSLRSLLKPNGFIQIIETVQQDLRITFIFGLLEGYWQFQDFDLRPYHTTLTMEKWKESLESVDFAKVRCLPFYDSVHGFIIASASDQVTARSRSLTAKDDTKFAWLIFSDDTELTTQLCDKLTALNRKLLVLPKPSICTEENIKNSIQHSFQTAGQIAEHFEGVIYLWGLSSDSTMRDQSQVSLPFVNLCQNLSVTKKPPRVYVVTQGLFCVEGSQVLNPTPGTLVGILKAVLNENTQLNLIHLDLSPDEQPVEQISDVFSNLWIEKNEIVVFREEKRLCARYALLKIPNDYISLPNGTDRFQLILPKTRLISDLEFGFLSHNEIDGKFVEVQTKAMALNFRDVFTVLKPIPIFEEINSIGLDYCGVVTKVGPLVTRLKVGDAVLGMNLNRNLALPSHIKVEEQLVALLPPDITFLEGVTLPAVFSTAVHCLVNVANIKKGETVLIHTASGGVGLAAIQIAKHVGATIIATAGSSRKRTFLKNLGIGHVFNSRTTEFGKQILEITNGHGVDIVLNSITGPGFKEASLNALGKNGRFVEMSKLSVWTPEEVAEIRPDVIYHVRSSTYFTVD